MQTSLQLLIKTKVHKGGRFRLNMKVEQNAMKEEILHIEMEKINNQNHLNTVHLSPTSQNRWFPKIWTFVVKYWWGNLPPGAFGWVIFIQFYLTNHLSSSLGEGRDQKKKYILIWALPTPPTTIFFGGVWGRGIFNYELLFPSLGPV